MTVALETIRSLRAVTPQNTIIEAQHVGQRFTADNGTELTVFDNISFNLYEGEIVAILGRSGAGKSTFLRALAGLVKPTSGTVKYRGKALTGPNPGIALVFQTFALMPWLTVQDNVELGLKARGVPRAERTKLALDAIDMIGLDGFESAYPKELSGGMRQRVGIARALVLRPDALFMDEPFSALDVLTAENLRQEVLKLWSSEQRSIKSVLMVTHNIEEAVEMADRVVVLGSHPGHLIADVRVDLQRPRDRHSVEFEAMVDRLYAILTGRPRSLRNKPRLYRHRHRSRTHLSRTHLSRTHQTFSPPRPSRKSRSIRCPTPRRAGLPVCWMWLPSILTASTWQIWPRLFRSRWTTCSRWWMPVRCCASSWYATAMCKSPRRATPGIRRTFCAPSRCSPHWRWNTRRWCTTLSMHCGSLRKASSAASSCWTCCAPVTPTTRRISSSPSPWSGAVTANSSITMPMTIC